jgi:Kef-type K+ transport system membrane component KefB
VRRALILVLLLIGMEILLPLGDRIHSTGSLLTFGFLILAAYTIGEVAAALKLPQLVGYLLAGVLFGPDLLNVVGASVIVSLAPIGKLAIALIAFLAGAELQWSELKTRGGTIIRILSAELLLTFVALLVLLLLLREQVPFLTGRALPQTLALAALFASLAIVHSPAVTMALLTETGARGPVARTTLGVVLLSDLFVVLFFSIVVAVARAVVPPSEVVPAPKALAVVWEIAGTLVVGGTLGVAIAAVLRFVEKEIFIFSVVVAFFGTEVARLAHVESLLTLLVAGFVVQNVPGKGEVLRHAMERSAAPIFVVFFALAGAQIDLLELSQLWLLVIPIVLVRAGALWAGTRIGTRWARAEPVVRSYTWLGLVSQAGVAIGLATVVAQVYPEHGAAIQTLFLGVLAVNQLVGPVLFRWALSRSGELEPAVNHSAPMQPADASTLVQQSSAAYTE